MVSERETMDNSLEGPQNGTATATAIAIAAAAEDNETSDSTKKCVPRKKMIITVLLVSRMLSASIFPLLQTSYPLEAKLRGIGNTMISLVFGIYPLTNVFAPQMIKYALFYLKLRNIIFAGLILSSTNTVLFGMLKYIPNEGSYNKVFIVLSFIVRALDSIGCGAMSNAIMIYFATEFPDIMSTLFGFMQFSIGFGYATAPLFGGILYDHGGFVLPFLVYGVVLAICIPCSMYLLTTNTYKQIEEKSSDSKSTYSWQIFFNGLYITVLTVPYAFQDVFLGVHFQDFSFSQTELGIMYFILSLSFCLSSILNVRITYKVSDSKILFIVSNIIFVGALLLCGPSPLLGIEHKYIWLDVVSLTLFGFFYNLSTTISYRDINEIIAGGTTEQTLQEASTINSIYYTSDYLGQFTGFLVAGTMLNTFGYNWSLTIMGLIIFLTDDGKKLLIAGFFMISFVLLFLGPVPISGIPNNLLWLNIVCLALLGVFVSLTVLPTYDMLLELAIEAGLQKSSSTYGLVSGIWGSMYAFGEFVGPSLSGFLMDKLGFQWCTTYMAIGCFSAGLLLFFIKIFEDFKEYGLKKLQIEERCPLLEADTQMKGFFGSYSM